MARFTVSFRGKLHEDGTVKVPAIASQHVSLFGNEDTATTIFMGCADPDITRARLANMIGAETGDHYWPSRASAEAGFTIEPIGSGFMANVSIELDTANMRRKA